MDEAWIIVSCWKCYAKVPKPGENPSFQSSSTSGTPEDIFKRGWRKFIWNVCPAGVNPRFWLCPEHAADPQKGYREEL